MLAFALLGIGSGVFQNVSNNNFLPVGHAVAFVGVFFNFGHDTFANNDLKAIFCRPRMPQAFLFSDNKAIICFLSMSYIRNHICYIIL